LVLQAALKENFAEFTQTGILKFNVEFFRALPAAPGFNIDLRCIHDKTELQFQT